MSREQVLDALRTAGPNGDCGRLRRVGLAACRSERDGAAWAHAGVLYRSKAGVFLLELATHRTLRVLPASAKGLPLVWTEPNLPEERARMIISKCNLVLKRHGQNAIPYGFRFERSSFDPSGSLRLGPKEIGLTCSTIVLAVFASERVQLVDPTSWPSPDEADKRDRERLIVSVAGRDPEHAQRLRMDVDAPRIRPEEVVAAGACYPELGTFESLVDGAAVVAEQLGL